MDFRGRIRTLPSREDEERITLKKRLFKSAMEGDWKEVVNLYQKHPEVHKAKFRRSGDTALHVAISSGQEDVVLQLVNLVRSNEALKVKNERGNTPLHFAASLGLVRACNSIASKDSKLIGVRNYDSETPFFLAALNGKLDVFLRLHYMFDSTEQGYLYCRRSDGETVLHSAINGDYFDLAFQIIHRYEKLVHYVNELGFSPLHLLASKPTAFRSGSHLGWFNRIIYNCIFVDELTVETIYDQPPDDSLNPSEDDRKNPSHLEKSYPENYHTCINFFGLVGLVSKIVFSGGKGWHQKRKNKGNDEEADAKEEDNLRQQRHQPFPINYATCFDTIKLISKATLYILEKGSREIKKIKEQKEQHTWSVQIMNELLRHADEYDDEYDDDFGSRLDPEFFETEETPYSFGEYEGNIFRMPDTEQITPIDNSFSTANQIQGRKSNEKSGEGLNTDELMKVDCSSSFPTAGEKMNSDMKGIREIDKRETPLLVAAKKGITEMVEAILKHSPVAIQDMNRENKNVVLLAVENRQLDVYMLLLKRNSMRDSVFLKVDDEGNGALHLAAKLGEQSRWLVAGAALQLQWESKWYQLVKESMPFVRYNRRGETPEEIFIKSHLPLIQDGVSWLYHASDSCSVAAALVTTVAFASSATLPGGVNDSGSPTLEKQPAFLAFSIATLFALCLSTISLVAFLSILTSRHKVKDFTGSLPRKFLIALTTLLGAIFAMLVSFSSSHFLIVKDRLQISAAYPLYTMLCLGASLFVVFQFPIYFDFLAYTFSKLPPRSYVTDELAQL
ncbi:uncharacterized protein LOC132311460 isoform X1 [Cornus florida]|uniref:uncharacterized protein LOC132311460 isoform X1 n=1 Tax=Cornus florida TaxID=4283 RepID=UPI00289EA18F|nr:uncharacterized protein LOC132311460 isoform X1 [Cornus florida]